MKCLYKVPFSGFFMAYAESAEEAKKNVPPMTARLSILSNPRARSRLAPMACPSRLTTITACLLTRQTMNLTRTFPRIGRMSCEY